jgi:GTP-binding protein EngB required for normal cell division
MTHALNSPYHAPAWSVALVGNPNCGKTALFNLLTGARQKVANYAGVTVERKVGTLRLANSQIVSVVDLPGAYSLTPATPDEQITLEVIEGRRHGEAAPDAIVAVVDATNLRMNLRLVLELTRLGRPLMVALNMADVARSQGLAIDVERLSAELGCPVVETVAVKHDGHAALLALLQSRLGEVLPATAVETSVPEARSSADLQAEVRRIMALVAPRAAQFQRFQHRIDAVVMHPFWGLALLAVVLFLMFQAVFSWAAVPMDAIKEAMAGLGEWTTAHMAEGPLRSLLVDGVIAGAGSVIVFLPQILILFFFILLLEDSGYLPRAAFLLDNLMGKVGLSGRAFIPLLSSFACAIPGIMATRTIANWKDRLATIMVAPLMTCSARLPVYALLIGAFVPERSIGGFNLRGPDAVRPLRRRRAVGDGCRMGLQAGLDQEPLSAADARAAAVSVARVAQPRDRAVGAGAHLHAPRRRHHLRADGAAVVPVELSGTAARCDRSGNSVQHRRLARPGAAACVRADRLQLADLDRAGAGPRGARGRGRCARHRLLDVGRRRCGRRCALAGHRPGLVARDRLFAARLVRVRAAMHVDPRGRQARDQFMALPVADGALPVRARVPCRLRDVPHHAGARRLTRC